MKLEAHNLVKTYRGRSVVNGASFYVAQGEIVGLLGPNGAGKTTSFYAVVGLVRPDQGRVELDGKDITGLPMFRRAQLGVLSQEASIFRKLSVENNIAAVLEWRGFSRREVNDRTEELLQEFGLTKVRSTRGDLLSGGERRRTEIARCLASDPKFILLDEPFAGVDPIAVEDIQAIVARLADERGIGVLITDHNVHETLAITDRTYLMFEGSIIKSGTAEELASDEVVRRVYLGQNFNLRRSGRLAEGGR
jgi:lipopolysaccharide export system ATP-binding protein